jgi:hypothetical protein
VETSGAMTFSPGDTFTVREVLHGQSWLEFPETVVHDDGQVLASVQADGSPLTFPEHPWPHPWGHLSAWQGTTVLKLRRVGDWYSVWKFFTDRSFAFWYVNFETPVVRRVDGVDINDLQLDVVIEPDGSWRWKDVEDLGPALASGRITSEELRAVLDEAAVVADLLGRDDRWWARWDDWAPGQR